MNFQEFKQKYQTKEVNEYSSKDQDDPLVSVCVQTFQHASYIRQCLEGILMQKTNFPFEILLGEDDSNDGTREICIEYAEKHPDKIRLFLHHRENNIKINGYPTGRFNYMFNFYSAMGKYVALCEGDDYWTDPLKLQKQVDFLENNKSFGLVFTDVDFYYENSKLVTKSVFKNNIKPLYTSFEDHLVNAGFLAPCTWLCRRELIPTPNTNQIDATFPWLLEVFKNSKVKYLPQNTSVYRILSESSSHSNSIQKRYNFALGVFDIQKEFLKKYKISLAAEKTIYRKAYTAYLPGALVLNDSKFINDAQNFWKCNPLNLKEKILYSLSYLKFSKYLFKLLYLLKGKKVTI